MLKLELYDPGHNLSQAENKFYNGLLYYGEGGNVTVLCFGFSVISTLILLIVSV